MLPDYIEYLLDESQHIEKLSSSEGNMFRGLLIKPGEWKGYTYTEEELKKAIPTIVGKMITLDHDDRFNSHVGIITNAYWDDSLGGIVIDFKVIDPTILNKLNAMADEGLLNQVGLSAELSYTTISNDSRREVKGITFKKATLTFYPAVGDARLISKLSLDRYTLNVIEQRDDGTLLVELIPTEELAKKKDDYPYPTPDKEAGKAYPAPSGYPIPPDEWKAVKDAIADLQKRVSALEKKLVKNTSDDISNSEDSNEGDSKDNVDVNLSEDTPDNNPQVAKEDKGTDTTNVPQPDNTTNPVPQQQPTTVQPTQPAQPIQPDTSTTVQQGPYPQSQPQVVAQPQPTQPQSVQTVVTTTAQTTQPSEPLKIAPDEPTKEDRSEVDELVMRLKEATTWSELESDIKKKIVEELLKDHPLFYSE